MGLESLSCDIIQTTEKAVRVAIPDRHDYVWIPKSVIDDYDCPNLDEPHDDVDLLVQDWWYKQHKKELE